MKLDEALILAGDCAVDVSADAEKAPCLFVFGEGIELKNEDEIELAKLIVAALTAMSNYINQGNQTTITSPPSTPPSPDQD